MVGVKSNNSLVKFFKTPLNSRINARKSIQVDFNNVVGTPLQLKERYSLGEVSKITGLDIATLHRHIINKNLKVESNETGKRKLITNSSLKEFLIKRQTVLSSSEAYELFCSRLAKRGVKADIGFETFLKEAEKRGIKKKTSSSAHSTIYFADVDKLACEIAKIISYPSVEQIAKEIGVLPHTLYNNLRLEPGLWERLIKIQIGKKGGSATLRVTPDAQKEIMRRQLTGMNSKEVLSYLQARGIRIPQRTLFTYLSKGVLKPLPEKDMSGFYRVLPSVLDDFIKNYPKIREQQRKRPRPLAPNSKRAKLKAILAEKELKLNKQRELEEKQRQLEEKEKERLLLVKQNRELVIREGFEKARTKFLQDHEVNERLFDTMARAYREKVSLIENASLASIEGILFREVNPKVNMQSISLIPKIGIFAAWAKQYKWPELGHKPIK